MNRHFADSVFLSEIKPNRYEQEQMLRRVRAEYAPYEYQHVSRRMMTKELRSLLAGGKYDYMSWQQCQARDESWRIGCGGHIVHVPLWEKSWSHNRDGKAAGFWVPDLRAKEQSFAEMLGFDVGRRERLEQSYQSSVIGYRNAAADKEQERKIWLKSHHEEVYIPSVRELSQCERAYCRVYSAWLKKDSNAYRALLQAGASPEAMKRHFEQSRAEKHRLEQSRPAERYLQGATSLEHEIALINATRRPSSMLWANADGREAVNRVCNRQIDRAVKRWSAPQLNFLKAKEREFNLQPETTHSPTPNATLAQGARGVAVARNVLRICEELGIAKPRSRALVAAAIRADASWKPDAKIRLPGRLAKAAPLVKRAPKPSPAARPDTAGAPPVAQRRAPNKWSAAIERAYPDRAAASHGKDRGKQPSSGGGPDHRLGGGQ